MDLRQILPGLDRIPTDGYRQPTRTLSRREGTIAFIIDTIGEEEAFARLTFSGRHQWVWDAYAAGQAPRSDA